MGVLNKNKDYWLDGNKVRVVMPLKRNDGRPLHVVVEYENPDGYLEYEVVLATSLRLWEDTWQYKQEKERKDAIEKLKKEHDELLVKMQDEAVKSLASRLKLNMIFADSGKMTGIGIAVLQELEKLIVKKDPTKKGLL